MKLTTFLFAFTLVFTLATAEQLHAQAYDVDFTIVGDPELGDTGTLTGELFGLSESTPGDDTSYLPTGLVIETGPGVTTPITEEFDYFSSPPGPGFTIVGDAVTDARFSEAFTGYGGATFDAIFSSGSIIPDANNVDFVDDTTIDITNGGGFAGVTYGSATAVPEPSQYGLGIFLAAASFVSWRRFKIRAA